MKCEYVNRIMDMLRRCRKGQQHYIDLEEQRMSLLLTVPADRRRHIRQTFRHRCNNLMNVARGRRGGLLLFAIGHFGLDSTWGTDSRVSRNDIIKDIERVGVEKVVTLGGETTNIEPLHNCPYFRPSRDTNPPTQGEEGEEDATVERLRNTMFSDEWITSAWFFLDCFAQSREQIASLMDLISDQHQAMGQSGERNPLRGTWCRDTMMDCVTLFWDAHYFLTSRVREAAKDFGHRSQREDTKAILNGMMCSLLPD